MLTRFESETGGSARELDAWLTTHEHDGFVLDLARGGSGMLHRASCSHCRRELAGRGLGPGPKVCSTDRRALTDWANGSGRAVELCDCV